MRTPRKRKLVVLLTALSLALVTAIPSGAAPEGSGSDGGPPAPEVLRGKYDSYVVVMKTDPLIVTEGQDNLRTQRARNRGQQMKAQHARTMRDVGLSPDRITTEYTNALNGFAARIGYQDAVKLAAHPEVAMVLPDELLQPDTDSSPAFIGLNPGPGGGPPTGATGKGVVIGVIDSGIWPEHPSFGDQGMPASPIPGLPCEFGNTAHNPLDAPFECNNKLIGARQMLATYRSVFGAEPFEFDSARDDNGHGTHTASTAAGRRNVEASVLGHDFGKISGIAPDAHIIAYKGLGTLGGFSSDLAAAIDQAVADGVDVINYSVGGSQTAVTADEIAFLFAADAGVHVATSAGNSGPGSNTVRNPAKVPWLTTVGANTQTRFIAGKVELGNGAVYEGASITQGTDVAPLVDAEDAGDDLCNPGNLDPDVVAGAIVLCRRGVIARVAKSQAVLEAGGVGMIMYENDDSGDLFTDSHFVPSVHVDNTPGLEIKAYIDAEGDNATARIFDTGQVSEWPYAPSMTSYSSRGPNVFGDIIKPDVTAPGHQILAGYSPVADPDGGLFAAIAGTSMASPHVAGLFALLKQAHPDWTPAMARSAMMTTADPDVLDNDRSTTANPFEQGSGMVDPGRANQKGSMFQPGLVYDATFDDYFGFLCDAAPEVFVNPAATCGALEAAGFATEAHNLNYPSIGVDELPGSITVTRTVTSVASENGWRTYTPQIEAPDGYSVTVSPSSLKLKPGQSATFEVTITNTGAPIGQWRFGSLTWTDNTGNYSVRSPIAVRGVALAAPAEAEFSGESGSREVAISVGYNGPFEVTAIGLAADTGGSDTVTHDPDQSFPGCGVSDGVIQHQFSLTGSSHLKIRLTADDLAAPANVDLDLYLCRGGSVVASSTAPGTEEEIDLVDPADGDYTLHVHGWQVPGGSVGYTYHLWDVSGSTGGSLQVDSAPTSVTAGSTATVGISWSGAGEEELGVLLYGDGSSTLGRTLITIRN